MLEPYRKHPSAIHHKFGLVKSARQIAIVEKGVCADSAGMQTDANVSDDMPESKAVQSVLDEPRRQHRRSSIRTRTGSHLFQSMSLGSLCSGSAMLNEPDPSSHVLTVACDSS